MWRVNLALITIDSLRADHVGCYGYERETTPNIDSVATDSQVFTSAIAHACATRPSFPSLLTSTHGMLYGGFDHLAEEQIPLAVPLSKHGYSTGGFHSNPYLSAEFGYGRGYDMFSDLEENPNLVSRVRRYVSNHLSGHLHDILSWFHAKAEEHGGVDIGAYYQDANSLTNEAINWMNSVEEPWFLWIHYMDPHHPYVPPDSHQLFGDILPDRRGVQLRQKVLNDPDSLSNDEWSDLIDLYDAEIHFVDEEVGRLIDNLSDATWILTADHGEEFYDHGNFGHKNRFYEEHVHVPLILGGGQSGTQDHLVGLNDVPVTLLEAANVQVPESYRGENLLSGNREFVLGGWGPNRGTNLDKMRLMARSDDGKLIRDTIETREEMYDLTTDPNEESNIVGKTDNEQYVSKLDNFVSEIRRTSTQSGRVEIGEDLENQLRNLGYTE